MRRHLRTLLLAVALCLSGVGVSPPPANATVLEAMSLADMIEASDSVVLARIERRGAMLDTRTDTVYTVTLVEVEQYIIGEGPSRLKIRQLGGRIGDRIMHVHGNASLRPGERVVLFLKKGDAPFVHIVSMERGAFHVQESNSPTNPPIVTREVTVPTASVTQQGTVLHHLPTDRLDGLSLDLFTRLIIATAGGTTP